MSNFETIATEKIHFTIGEVAKKFDVNSSLIRFWEKEFDVIKPHKNSKGRRFFTQKDVDNFHVIYRLVKEEGLTLDGARKRLKNNVSAAFSQLEMVKSLTNIKTMLLDIKQTL
ncbi:transcriptional regulator [Bacteroidia bacterium]|nr:transcriptional regulator [Bacteroidia bacterium]